MINITNVEWYFNMTHYFLLGVERGMYNNDSLEIDKRCFGPQYAARVNWLAAMFQHDPLKHWIPVVSLIYQGYYMISEECKIDLTLSDMFIYCWNENCEADDIKRHLEKNFLYMTRALIDAGIVWWEGVPSNTADDLP